MIFIVRFKNTGRAEEATKMLRKLDAKDALAHCGTERHAQAWRKHFRSTWTGSGEHCRRDRLESVSIAVSSFDAAMS